MIMRSYDPNGLPEAKIDWWVSTTGARSGYTPWTDNGPLSVVGGEPFWVRVGVTNVGETSAFKATLNVVAPVDVYIRELLGDGTLKDPLTGFENEQVGAGPEYSVKLLVSDRYWPKNLLWATFYQVVVPAALGVRLMVEVNDAFHEYQSFRSIVTT